VANPSARDALAEALEAAQALDDLNTTIQAFVMDDVWNAAATRLHIALAALRAGSGEPEQTEIGSRNALSGESGNASTEEVRGG
jgi:hypothetical protein